MRLTELGIVNRQKAFAQIHVSNRQPKDLPNAASSYRKQAKDSVVGTPTQLRGRCGKEGFRELTKF